MGLGLITSPEITKFDAQLILVGLPFDVWVYLTDSQLNELIQQIISYQSNDTRC
jgi:hypothetical protein